MKSATPAATVGAPAIRRRRRKPKAQTVLFKKVFTTSVVVPWKTNETVIRFQDVLRRLEPALQTRPNAATTAGWLLREGFRFAARNRVKGLAGPAADANAADSVQLGIHIDRTTWADLQRWVVAEGTTLGNVVPRLIALGAEQHAPLAPPPTAPRRAP